MLAMRAAATAGGGAALARRSRCAAASTGAPRRRGGRRGVPLPLADRPAERAGGVATRAATEEVYAGRYGPWSITTADRVEVVGYRLGITATALAFLFVGVYGLLPADLAASREAMRPWLDAAVLGGATGLGASLVLIHIYVSPLKRALQVLWALGTAGAVYVMATQDAPAAVFVYEHRAWVWAVGPLFAALTGVAFKEGLCYGKLEAAGLFGALPLLVGGHLLGIWPDNVESGLLAANLVLLSVFAARKYTQVMKDDIGDKSIFEFQKMSPEQQRALLLQLGAAAEDDM